MASRDPVDDLRRIAFYLERANEATYRVRAFRSAAAAIEESVGAAEDALRAQVRHVSSALDVIADSLPAAPKTIVVAGSGEFLARRALEPKP